MYKHILELQRRKLWLEKRILERAEASQTIEPFVVEKQALEWAIKHLNDRGISAKLLRQLYNEIKLTETWKNVPKSLQKEIRQVLGTGEM